MAQVCAPCACTPYQNLCYCGPVNGIAVSQPKCQVKPDGLVVGNPCFDPIEKVSYWTYKFTIDGAPATRGLSNFVIPVCNKISKEHIHVDEFVDGCGTFTRVPFSLAPSDPLYGPAPAGFNWLKVEVNDRYDKGVCVVYRLKIVGDFTPVPQPIRAKAGPPILIFDCDPKCYLVPSCPAMARLVMTKDCEEVIDGATALLRYRITVANQGGAPAENVQYLDQIAYDASEVTLGDITVEPPTLSVMLLPNVIMISGNLGTIPPGGVVEITYTVQLVSFAAAGKFMFANMATASSSFTEASASCMLNVDVVQLAADKCCLVEKGREGLFRVTISSVGQSPMSMVSFRDRLTIPAEVTVQFTSFDGCAAVFADSGLPVPLNSDVSGRTIFIVCPGLTVPESGSVSKTFRFHLVSVRNFVDVSRIINTLQEVNFLTGDTQAFLGVSPIPVSAEIEVSGMAVCKRPCT